MIIEDSLWIRHSEGQGAGKLEEKASGEPIPDNTTQPTILSEH